MDASQVCLTDTFNDTADELVDVDWGFVTQIPMDESNAQFATSVPVQQSPDVATRSAQSFARSVPNSSAKSSTARCNISLQYNKNSCGILSYAKSNLFTTLRSSQIQQTSDLMGDNFFGWRTRRASCISSFASAIGRLLTAWGG
eukprot:10838113-Ditylum_brightwellii.AAC.2